MNRREKRVLDQTLMGKILTNVARTLPEELTCDECLQELDRYAEMKLLGQPVEEAMPLVAQHLAVCRDCREEFEALLRALEAEQAEGA